MDRGGGAKQKKKGQQEKERGTLWSAINLD